MHDQTYDPYQKALDNLKEKETPCAKIIFTSNNKTEVRAKIGVLDASFNPMTVAHQALYQHAQETYQLDETLLLLSGTNVDKKISGATLPQRLAMLVSYAHNVPNISVGICSHARFVDKITALRTCYSQPVSFYFIIGYDTLTRLFDAKYYEDMPRELAQLFAQSYFIAANRGHDDLEAINTFLKQEQVVPFANCIFPLNLPEKMAEISSTAVREAVIHQTPIDHLVPPPIAQAILEFGLYRE